MGRDKEFPLSPELEGHLEALLKAVGLVREVWGRPMSVSSGYRPGYWNTRVGGAPNSAHSVCQACDFRDTDRLLAQFLVMRPDLLVRAGLYMEDPRHTPGWVHLQTRRPPSGNRIFIPF
jgi:hypothetical protein